MDNLEIKQNSVKQALAQEKIQLWMSPYYSKESGPSEENLTNLSQRLCKTVNLTEEATLEYLKNLQNKALNNLKEQERFILTGEATLKVRAPHITELLTISVKLNETGANLKETVAKKLGLPSLKLICKGKVIQDELLLEQQGVKHGCTIMVLQILKNAESDLSTFEANTSYVDSTKKDIKFLTGKRNVEFEHFLQITDQSGKKINLPAAEKNALILAMTLHEKGRGEMKKDNFNLALVLLLEAEEEFRRCNSSLLEYVDNYGLLSLDIAWCYLCLQSLTYLPNAEQRLNKCEKSFQKSYGSNLERLIAVKGSAGNEIALLVRLHLLQAIVFYHQNNFNAARELFNRVEKEINELKVDDNKLSQLMGFGYGRTESRLALRESKGDVGIAVSIIENKRAENVRVRENEKKQAQLDKQRKLLGKCKNGSWIEPQLYEALIEMGCTPDASKWALAQTNNDVSASISLIQDNPEKVPFKPTPQQLEQVVCMGFVEHMAEIALRKYRGDVTKAIEYLVENSGFISADNLSPLPEVPSSKSSTSSSSTSPEACTSKAEQEDAFKRIAEGISSETDDYLDLTLQAEEEFLKTYKQLLESNK